MQMAQSALFGRMTGGAPKEGIASSWLSAAQRALKMQPLRPLRIHQEADHLRQLESGDQDCAVLQLKGKLNPLDSFRPVSQQ